MCTKIELIYFGIYQRKTGKHQESLLVDEDIETTVEFIKAYLNDMYGLKPPFSLLINGMHMVGAIKKGIRLKGGDELKLIPFLSGG